MLRASPEGSLPRGQSLVEIAVVLAILLAAAAIGTYGLQRAAASQSATREQLRGLFDAARALAATSGDGATIVFDAPAQSSGPAPAVIRGRLFGGRPRSGGTFDVSVPWRSLVVEGKLGSSLGTPFALFVDPAGSWSAAAWSPASGTIAAEPACSDLDLVLSSGEAVAHLACGDRLRL